MGYRAVGLYCRPILSANSRHRHEAFLMSVRSARGRDISRPRSAFETFGDVWCDGIVLYECLVRFVLYVVCWLA